MWEDMLGCGVPHAHPNIGITANSEGLDEHTTIERDLIEVDLLFDVFGVHTWLLETGWMSSVDETAVCYGRHVMRIAWTKSCLSVRLSARV